MLSRAVLNGRKGVTLVEAVIAIAIVFVIVSGTAYIIYSTIVQEMNSERLSTANNLAREQIEYLKGLGYGQLTVGETTTTVDSNGQEDADGLYTVKTVIAEDIDPTEGYSLGMKTITVEVYVNRPEQVLLVTQSTKIHRRGV